MHITKTCFSQNRSTTTYGVFAYDGNNCTLYHYIMVMYNNNVFLY
jgi:hypothetical protein